MADIPWKNNFVGKALPAGIESLEWRKYQDAEIAIDDQGEYWFREVTLDSIDDNDGYGYQY